MRRAGSVKGLCAR